MPELPDLEIIREVLDPRLAGVQIASVELVRPLVVRDLTGVGFAEALEGRTMSGVSRRGKLLLIHLDEDLVLAVNCKLAGRLQYAQPEERRLPKTHVVLGLSDGRELRYSDRRTMGQIYLSTGLEEIPGWADMGPEPFELTLQEFKERLKPFRGEIKGVLTRGQVVAGIGNAYGDEICFRARVHPYRKRTSLADDEVARLYGAMLSVLSQAVTNLRERVGTDIHVEVRDFLAVHGRGGQPCPACGTTISEISARGPTNFCRSCQPGGLVRL
jgi:formamidopyrimidine-DNA glycosylase